MRLLVEEGDEVDERRGSHGIEHALREITRQLTESLSEGRALLIHGETTWHWRCLIDACG